MYRKPRPITAEKERLLYHRTKVDVMDQKWYDEREERQPGWPEKFEHAKIEKVGEEPVRDTRLEVVKKWRRPLSEEKIRHPRDQKQLLLQQGQNLKTLLGKESVQLLKQNASNIKKERKEHNPDQVLERHTFNQFFTRTDFNPVQKSRDEKLADLY